MLGQRGEGETERTKATSLRVKSNSLKNVLFNPDVSLSFRDWTVDYTGKMY